MQVAAGRTSGASRFADNNSGGNLLPVAYKDPA